ncbi:hypothetical protein BDB00DRAFT_831731 [Zychaea mexicana]|uniref:uncharacterized protein n=1 Tax=Zychaea mexicana TaxID=64656 RepID=UPI0022FEBB84|nr:uncharacterized protein BDB00DRAFT_831731 [Zychaea mexicana]KAI9491690.1 hypothetical protein BDB00DRAFT_831731 [Zychaea mexicana]
MTSDCTICSKTVYVTEKVEANGRRYHKTCFKCSEKGCRLSITNFQSHDGHLFCQKHVPKLQAIIKPAHHGRARSDSDGKQQQKQQRMRRHQEGDDDGDDI